MARLAEFKSVKVGDNNKIIHDGAWEPGVIYLDPDHKHFKLPFLCPCKPDCRHEANAHGHDYTLDDQGRITLNPSVAHPQFKEGVHPPQQIARPHYWVKANQIQWEADSTDHV